MAALAIALSIPVFFVLIAIEAWVAARQGRRVYRFNDAITNLSCGIGQQMTHLGFAAVEATAFVAMASHAVLPTWPHTWWAWLLTLVLYDHQYYWWHRTTHRSNLFWTSHVVHHQSEDYNLAVALRQAWFSPVTNLPFFLPLAWIGAPLDMILVVALVDLLYQFWIHTELIGRLGPLEQVFNTASHHRVHHAVNPMYIDKNYAGIFIVWDRLYGTFVDETVAPTYGVVEPIRSFDPIAANFTPLVSLVRKVRSMPDAWSAVRAVFAPPEWRPAALGGPIALPEPVPHRITWDPRAAPAVNAYILVQFALAGVGSGLVLARWDVWDWPARGAAVLSILAATWTWGALFEGRRLAAVVDGLRIATLPVVGLLVTAAEPSAPWVLPLSVAVALASAGWWLVTGRRAILTGDAS